jgi:hypothetical protein
MFALKTYKVSNYKRAQFNFEKLKQVEKLGSKHIQHSSKLNK